MNTLYYYVHVKKCNHCDLHHPKQINKLLKTQFKINFDIKKFQKIREMKNE